MRKYLIILFLLVSSFANGQTLLYPVIKSPSTVRGQISIVDSILYIGNGSVALQLAFKRDIVGNDTTTTVKNGGNYFGGAMTVGTNDANSLGFKVGGATRINVLTNGSTQILTPAGTLRATIDSFGSYLPAANSVTTIGNNTIQMSSVVSGIFRSVAAQTLQANSGTGTTTYATGTSGKLGIGTVISPLAFLHVQAGTTATPSIIIDPGTLSTTIRDGGLENSSASGHLTIAIGGTRYQLDRQNQGSGVTTLTVGIVQTGSDTKPYIPITINSTTYYIPALTTLP